MEKRELDQEELAATCLCAPAIPLYPSTNFCRMLHFFPERTGYKQRRHSEITANANERYPDFKHKKTGEALWLEDGRNPPWVAER